MADMVAQSRRLDELLNQVAAGARQQGVGMLQIGQAVTRLDQATQKNAALVSQTAAAANAMNGEARSLAELVAVFRLPAG
jgi:methyl-accepting chemotaxis protein